MGRKKAEEDKVDDIKIEAVEEETSKAAEVVEKPKEELSETEKLQSELGEANDKFLRLRAEFDNFRKRTFKDISNSRLMAQIDTALPFLKVFDHFSMAMKSAEVSDNIEALMQGLNMILKEYEKAFDDLNIVKFDAVGEQFDPNLHDAMAKEHSEEVEEGIVLKQWSCGYKMGERLLKPACVVVSSGPESK